MNRMQCSLNCVKELAHISCLVNTKFILIHIDIESVAEIRWIPVLSQARYKIQ
jgi:hypothetical protein